MPVGLVEAGRPQLHSAEVGLAAPGPPSRARGRSANSASRVLDLLARVLDRAAVEVGAGAGRRGRGVGHLVGAGGREPHAFEGYAEGGRGDLEHLGVQALAHLGAAVVDQHRAVLVDVHQRPGLVEGGEVEGDPELHRRHRQPALGVLVRVVERGDLGQPLGDPAVAQHLVPGGERSARDGAPAGRTAWPGPRRRSCVGAGRSARCRAGERSGRGCPRSRASPAARRSRGTRSATSCWCGRPGRGGGRGGSSRRCRRGTAPAPARAR